MSELTGVERIGNILNHKPVDRIGVYETFWADTRKHYADGGYLAETEDIGKHFGYDIRLMRGFNYMLDINFKEEILEETDETILAKDGNGAILRRHKLHSSTPEHVDFSIKCREDWEEKKELLTKIDENRIYFEQYRNAKETARQNNEFFCWTGLNVFECMHPICGHENMLVGMALDPDWIIDMCETYTNMNIALSEILFAKEGKPDGIWYYEDMGFKERPFMSPAMYEEIIMPSHKKSLDFAHSMGLKTIMHSCGFIEPLLPYMVEAGIDCLQAMEIKAGMDLIRIYNNFGDKIALMGGIDVRKLYSNDKKQIEEELLAKIPTVMKKNGYILHSDHSIPNTVEYDTLKYFTERGKEIGTYR